MDLVCRPYVEFLDASNAFDRVNYTKLLSKGPYINYINVHHNPNNVTEEGGRG